MAKNLKIQIKNTQLAEAINIKGLKAQLKKNRDDGSEPHVEEATPSLDLSKTERKKPKKAAQDIDQKKNDKNISSQQTKSESRPVDADSATQRAVSTLEKSSTQPSDGQKPVDKKTVVREEKEAHSLAPMQEKKIQDKKSFEKSGVHSNTSIETPNAQKADVQKKEPKESPLFLSATKKNPDFLGPVLDKPTKVAPAKESLRKLEEQPSQPTRQYGDRAPSRAASPRREGSHREGPYREGSHREGSHREGPYREGGNRDFSPRPARTDGQAPGYRGDHQYNRGERPPYRDDRNRTAVGRNTRDFHNDGRAPSSRSDSYPQRVPNGATPQRVYPSGPRPLPSSATPRPSSSQGYQSNRGYAPRHPSSGGPTSGGYGRRNEGSGDGSGFRPQPFAQRSETLPSAKSAPGWDRAQPQKEGLDERSQQRRLISQSEIEEKKHKFKDAKEGKATFKKSEEKEFNSRIRHGFQAEDEDESRNGWKKKKLKNFGRKAVEVQEPTRPTKIKVRIPISVKDLAQEMKLKAAQLVTKLFLQGVIVTLNDLLDDETILQLLGHEFGCEVEIDTSEQERLKLSEKSIREEIQATDEGLKVLRPPVIAFMGHVDHGKTSLIDAIRKTNKAQNEVGAITQHIGAFSCNTSHGPVTILDTPGHEAFSAMRERGAEITDIAILVVAGDEGMKEQTIEAMNQAKAAHSTIVVAINKCDKPNFDQEKVYRQLAEQDLLPEAWGGQTITVNCSAVTGEGIQSLLEMVALQSEVLELQADPSARARGTVIESAMYKGLGPVATILIQNGSLKLGDALVFDYHWAKVKSMKDDAGQDIAIASPSTPVRINGLSNFPEAGEEFVVVSSEKEAKAISEARQEGKRQLAFQMKKKFSLENMAEKAGGQIKVMNVILRADVQGSLEALKTALGKIESKKVELNIVTMGVGEISESDVQLANASKSTIIGFHTQIESHAEPMLKELGVQYRLYDIIYHAQDGVREIMKGLLDKIAQEHDRGAAEVRALFKSSHLGMIAGCQVIDGTITRSYSMKLIRNGSIIWKGSISSLKRFKEDVKEVSKGTECGIILSGFSEFQVGDIMQSYETTYLTQDL